MLRDHLWLRRSVIRSGTESMITTEIRKKMCWTCQSSLYLYSRCLCICSHSNTLENRYGFWPQTGCITIPGREAAFLVARQRFPYRSRFNFSVKTWKICYCAMQSAIKCISISLGKYIVEQMMHPLAFSRSSSSQTKAHKMWMLPMFWDILRQ